MGGEMAGIAAPVAVVNESTVLDGADLQPVVTALQTQLDRDFAPAWHTTAELALIPSGQQPPAEAWWLVLLDDADQAGALGYHDLTSAGLPMGKVFVRTAQDAGVDWQVTASHELLETLADPYIDLTVFDMASDTTGTLYAYEACDAVEAAQYEIDGVPVSDFVTPQWFERGADGPFDHLRQTSAAFELLSGGYIGVFEVTGGGGWTTRTNGDPVWRCSCWDTRGIPRGERVRSRPFTGTSPGM
jgi:hypothetical protein